MSMIVILVVLAYGPLNWSFPSWVWAMSFFAPAAQLLLASLMAGLTAIVKSYK